MHDVPETLDGAWVLAYCALDGCTATGLHQLIIDGKPVRPTYAAVCSYGDDSPVYHFSCNEAWEVIGDFDYDSLEAAIEHIDRMYRGARERMTYK